jgi:flagellar biosynthetic protein FlhB
VSDEDLQEKTEDPSERRKRESREKGIVVRSKELTNLVALLGGVLILKSYGKKLSQDFKDIFRDSLSFSTDAFKDDYFILKHLKETMLQVSFSILPILIFCLILAVFGSVIVGGLNLSLQSLGFKFERLNPLKGIMNIFSSKTLVDLIKSLIKFTLLAITFFVVIKGVCPKIFSIDNMDVFAGIDIAIDLFLWVSLMICLPLIVVTLIDVPYQQWTLNQMLKMTKKELQDESKDADVNPEVKRRIRKLQYEMSKRKMLKDLPNADVVITNPEHFAVALRYDATKPGAPVVLAKGLDLMAELIKKISISHKIPIVEAPSVARSLLQ